MREVGVQADECKDDYDKRPINTDESSSQYYENSESVSTSESELGVNSDPAVCEKNHKRVIIEKDSEIIVLKNELGVRSDLLVGQNLHILSGFGAVQRNVTSCINISIYIYTSSSLR